MTDPKVFHEILDKIVNATMSLMLVADILRGWQENAPTSQESRIQLWTEAEEAFSAILAIRTHARKICPEEAPGDNLP
jgi:hypothetical protein